VDGTRPGGVTTATTAEHEARERLRAAGLRVTRPRLLALEALRELGGHRSAEELSAFLRRRGTPLPRASVYNSLDALVRAGLVMLADAGPGSSLYEAGAGWHHHFVCSACGKVLDVPCLTGETPCLHPDGIEGQVEEAQVIFRGLCSDCAAKKMDVGD
jgi:Fe2+ or Zn2+ uptake regulation protein